MARPVDSQKDRQLLDILSANARLPVSDIAKKVALSRTTVQARIERLERDGYIAGYTIVRGAAAQINDVVSAVVMVELEQKRQAGAVSEFRKRHEIVSCHTLNGPYDLMLIVGCATPQALDDLIDWIARIDGVRRTTSSLMLARKFER